MSPESSDAQSRNKRMPDPVSFMRGRRPDEYSDSETTSSVELTQGLLEYHLETLTNRSQETEFAYFARRLAEKEICPNLRSQTGPTGGGDSKADSETIPVSSEIAQLWIGSDPAAANERWAFAFSAKKDWKAKVRSDVRSIASTERHYTRVYFITNQFAPDKSRADSEDTLSKDSGMRVIILDRSWIIKAVIENGRAEIAIEALKIQELRSLVEKKIGPADLERQRELEDLERAIGDPNHYQGAHYQLVEDALRAAILARGLSRPRTEIDGLFIRADRLATQCGNVKQRLRIAYAYAWTAVFWFNDVSFLNSLYDTVEGFALKSDQMEDLELLQNLWMVLFAQIGGGGISAANSKIDARSASLRASLKELAAQETRPNNALQARTSLALLSMNDAMIKGNSSALSEIWKEFTQIVTDAENLGDYPFERLVNLLEAIGELGVDSPEFDTLFEVVIEVLEKRRGETSGAEILRDRGMTKMDANKQYEAIRLLGRAIERFVKREHRDNLIFCLMVLSNAYVRAGLLWAGRNCALAATERCLAYFNESGRLIPITLPCIEQLSMLEMRLGRIAHYLMTHELEMLLAPQMMLRGNRLARFNEHQMVMDGMLGILLLTASLAQLSELAELPETLESEGLVIAKGLLLYALGYRDELRNEGFSEESWPDGEIDKFMQLAIGQPGRLQLPDRPQIETDSKITYHTNLLGCAVTVEAAANSRSIQTAEAILGTLEAFFATSLTERIMPYRPSERIVIEQVSDLVDRLRIDRVNEAGEGYLRVQFPESSPRSTPEARQKYRDDLMGVVGHFISHATVVDDIAAYMEKIAGEERGFVRALLSSDVSLAEDNIFGKSLRILIADWAAPRDARRYPLNRAAEWSDGIEIAQMPLPKEGSGDQEAKLDPRAYFRSKAESGRHTDRKILSMINIPLWDAAKWSAIGFLGGHAETDPPGLGLAFLESEPAAAIFEQWCKQLGKHDESNKIRVTIVRGIDRTSPAAYRVCIGSNIDRTSASTDSVVTAVCRINTMYPRTTEGLDKFLEVLDKARSYFLMPVRFISEDRSPEILSGSGILKDELIVRQAWQIGLDDIDAMTIGPDDDPIVPHGVKDVPVFKLIELLKSRGKTKDR